MDSLQLIFSQEIIWENVTRLVGKWGQHWMSWLNQYPHSIFMWPIFRQWYWCLFFHLSEGFCSLPLVSPSTPSLFALPPRRSPAGGLPKGSRSYNRLLFPVTGRLRLAVIGLAGVKSGCNCGGRDGERVDVMAQALWVFDKTWPSRGVSLDLFKMFVLRGRCGYGWLQL